MRRRKFPVFAVIVLAFATVWFLNALGVWNINVPWIPLILIIIALGWIINRYVH